MSKVIIWRGEPNEQPNPLYLNAFKPDLIEIEVTDKEKIYYLSDDGEEL